MFLLIPISVNAFTVKTSDSIYVSKDEVLEGSLYAGGMSVTIDGTVNGDVICGAQTININGTVNGDVICGAQTININGTVNGDVRVAGDSIILNGPISRNVQAFGASIIQGADSIIEGEVFLAGAIGEIRGKINGDLHGAADIVNISGEIGKDVRLRLGKQVRGDKQVFTDKDRSSLIISDEAKIGGHVYYVAGEKGKISDKAVIGGEIGHSFPEKKDKKDFAIFGAMGGLFSVFSALVIGLVVISIWREQIKKITDKMLDKVGASIGWGVIIMFLTPIVAILLLITLIGIPLSIIIICLWLIALYASKILVGILIGRNLIKKLFPKRKRDSLIWAMIIGIIIVWIISAIPVIGWLICLIAVWWGLGGLWLYFRKN